MRDAIADARARGDHALLLEVIEQNTPAVKLYTSLGFRLVRRLVGYRWEPGAARRMPGRVREIDPLELARVVHREGGAGAAVDAGAGNARRRHRARPRLRAGGPRVRPGNESARRRR